jgi:hypothetical protein
MSSSLAHTCPSSMKGWARASFNTAPLSSMECKNRSSSRHNCQSLASTALRSSRKASSWPVSSCSRLCRTRRYEPAVRSRCELRHVCIGTLISLVFYAAGATYLEQRFWVTHDVEQTAPTRHFCLARTTHYHIEGDVEMV